MQSNLQSDQVHKNLDTNLDRNVHSLSGETVSLFTPAQGSIAAAAEFMGGAETGAQGRGRGA